MDREVWAEFKLHCKDKSMKFSTRVETLVKNDMKKIIIKPLVHKPVTIKKKVVPVPSPSELKIQNSKYY